MGVYQEIKKEYSKRKIRRGMQYYHKKRTKQYKNGESIRARVEKIASWLSDKGLIEEIGLVEIIYCAKWGKPPDSQQLWNQVSLIRKKRKEEINEKRIQS